MSASEPEAHVPPSGVWEAPPIAKEWHESWESFNQYMEKYQADTHQLFKMRTSTSVSRRNTDITQAAVDSEPDLIPEGFKTYWIKLICTHGWRRKSRSTGLRKTFFSKSTACKADVKALVTWNQDEGKFMVRVTGSNPVHNHRVDEASYDNHPSVRRVEDPVLLAFVDVLQSAGSKPKRIVQFLREKTGQNVTLRDVHNMVARMRERRRGTDTVEQRLETRLRDFCTGKGNRAAVYVDDESLAQTIVLQTRQMRRWFKAFPEVLLVDATHNTNDSRYKLFSFMVHDVYGHGQYVQHSLMENESAECLTDAIGAFKFSNPSWEKIRVIVIDKDMGELSLLESHFSQAKVILCHFHLKKYIRSEMSKSEYGGPGSFDKDQVEDAVDMMRTSATMEDYTKYLKYLYLLLDDVHLRETNDIPEAKHPFLRYFMKNWDQQKERWALYARSDVPHLGNHTNNRLESSWGHMKEILKPEMPLDECVDTLIFLQAVAEMEYTKKINAVGFMHYDGADAELDRLSREVSTHAYRQIESQYLVAKDRSTHYNVTEVTTSMFIISGCGGARGGTYHVDTSKYRCSCVFMRTMLLPCRHVMYWRLVNGKSAIPTRHIAPRWRLTCKMNQPAEEEDAADDQVARKSFQVRDSMMVAARHQVLNGTTKFKTASRRGARIADVMSRNGTTVFNGMLAALEKFEEIVNDGIVPLVSRGDNQCGSTMGSGGSITTYGPGEPDDEAFSDVVPLTQPHQDGTIDTGSCNASAALLSESRVPGVTREVPIGTPGLTHVPKATPRVPQDTPGSTRVPQGTPEPASVPQGTTGPSGVSEVAEEEAAAADNTPSFTLTKSSKSRGRPKVRKQQKAPAKKRRMSLGMERASKLVQGTLAPVPNVTNLVKLLNKDYSYNDIHKSVRSLLERVLPQSKKAIAGVFTTDEFEADVRYVFPRWYVRKAQAAITQFCKTLKEDFENDCVGVRVPRFGVYSLKDMNAMARWHAVLENVELAEEVLSWAANSSNKRIALPAELSDGVSDDIGEREEKIKRMLLRGRRQTPFGSLPYLSLFTMCGNRWADDACIGHGLALLQRENQHIGIVDPIFHRFKDKKDKLRQTVSGNPFDTSNELILLALHVDDNHWCGIVFDIRRETKSITVFDPLQAAKSKYYAMCETVLQDVFGELCRVLSIKRYTASRQSDVASCGVMVLTFFECFIRGISMPTKPTAAQLRFLRLRYLLKCIP